MSGNEEAGDELERAALAASGVEPEDESEVNGIPCCPECGRPVDDVEKMTEVELLDAIRIGLLRDLARSLATGTATHQEKAIAKGLLRDNSSKVDPTVGGEGNEEDGEEDEGTEARPIRRARIFGDSKG